MAEFYIRVPDPDRPGTTRLQRINDADVARYQADGRGADIVQTEGADSAAIAREGDVQRRQAIVRDMPVLGRVATAGLSYADGLLLGIPGSMLSEDERRTREAAEREYAGTALAGTVAGVVAPAVVTGGATLTQAGRSGAAFLPGGLAQATGNSAARALARRLAPTMGERGARALGMVGGAVAEGGIGGMLNAVEQANIQGTPYEAEAIISGGLFGAGLGLGAGGLGALGQGVAARFSRGAIRQAEAVQAAGMGLPDGVRILPDGQLQFSPPSFAASNPADMRSWMGRVARHPMVRRLSGLTHDAADSQLNRVFNNIDDAINAESTVTRMAGDASETLEGAFRRGSEAAAELRSAQARAGRFFADMADDPDLVRATGQEMSERAALLRQRVAEGGRRLPAAEATRLNRVADMLEEVTARGGNSRQLAAELDQTLDAMRTQSLRGVEGGTDVEAALYDTYTTLRSHLGNLGEGGGRALQAHDLLDNFDRSMANLRQRGVQHYNLREEAVDVNPGKVFQSLGDFNYRVAPDYSEAIETSLEDMAKIRRFFDPEDTLGDVVDAGTALRDMRYHAQLASDVKDLQKAEGIGAGLFAASGLGGVGLGGLVGGAVGGPVGAVLGAATGAAFSMGTHPMSTARRLGGMRRGIDSAGNRLTAGVSRVRTFLSRGSSFRAGAGEAARQVPRAVIALRSAETRADEYRTIRDQITDLTSNPEALSEMIAATTQDVGGVNPDLQTHLADTYVRGIFYLQDNLPAADMPSPWDRFHRHDPSHAEMDSFRRRYEILEDPMSVFDRVVDYSLTEEHVEALRTVYPALYARVQAEMASVLDGLDNLPPYPARMALGTLLDIPSDPMLEPEFLFRLQQNYSQTGQQDQAQNTRQSHSISTQHRVTDNTYSESQSMEIRL